MSRESLPAGPRPYVRIDADAGETLASVSRERIRELYKEHGALLLRGFAGGLEQFRQLAIDLCPVAVQNESRNRAKLGPSMDLQSASLGTRAFPLHPELSREPWKPDTAFFYCVRPPVTGGSTTICDGVAIVRGLDPYLRDQMANRRVIYMHPARPNELRYWLGVADPDDAALADPPPHCPYHFERVGKQVARIFTRPFLHRPMFTDELAFGNFLLFGYFLRGHKYPLLDDRTTAPDEWLHALKEIGDRLTVPIEWQEGDLLILDNTRFLHGRTEITEGDGRLIATYFGYVDFAAPDPEEPPNPIWRRPGFHPPALDRSY